MASKKKSEEAASKGEHMETPDFTGGTTTGI